MSAWESFRRSVRRNLRSLGWALSSPEARAAKKAVAGWNRALDLGERAVAERDAAERERQYAIEDRDKHKRRADALAVEVEQFKARLAEAKDERDGLVQSLAATARRNGELASMIEASPERVRQACLDLSDEVFGLRRRNAELQRERAS